MILGAAFMLFAVPMVGGIGLLLAMIGVFIVANLGVGFMFPFRAMPQWAQHVGEIPPLTHFLRIVRGILLNGNVASQLWGELWQMLVFLLVAGLIALRRYRQTID